MLIKTDSQNYTNIANAIRSLTGSTKQYRPEEMKPALDECVPDYGISFSSDGLTATTYGTKVFGFTRNSLIKEVNISDEAVEIGSYAFANCGLENITLPNSIKTIGYQAFNNSALKSIVLPDGLESIGANVFVGTDLETINLPDSLNELGGYAFSACYNLKITNVPDGVTRIESGAFRECRAITEFIFHENVKVIGLAFYGCSSLAKVTFKGTPDEIDDSAFNKCTKLVEINVPWSKDEVANAPWGATNATINYNYTG